MTYAEAVFACKEAHDRQLPAVQRPSKNSTIGARYVLFSTRIASD